MTDEGYIFLPLYDAEVDEDKKQKIINLLNELGIKEFSCLTKGEIHFLNLTDSQVKKLLEAQSNEYKNDFYLLGIRKHPNTPMHYYLQLKNWGKDMIDKYTVIDKKGGGIKMRFKKLSEYDEEIKRIDEILDNFKEYINNYPQEMGVKPTYISMKYLREELKKEKDKLEFYKSTQEAFDRCDDSKKGMSVEEFLKELER